MVQSSILSNSNQPIHMVQRQSFLRGKKKIVMVHYYLFDEILYIRVYYR